VKEDKVAASEKAVNPHGKRLTPSEWARATALWRAGEVTLEELGKQFDRHPQSFAKYFGRRGIKKGDRAHLTTKAVENAVERKAIKDAELIAARIRETKEEHYKMASGLAKLTWAEILKAKQDGVPLSAILNNIKTLDAASSVLRRTREDRYAVLGLDRADAVDEDDVPQLVISELTAEQIENLRKRNFRELSALDDMEVGDIDGSQDASADDDDDEVVEES
jgi:hypothetical protein